MIFMAPLLEHNGPQKQKVERNEVSHESVPEPALSTQCCVVALSLIKSLGVFSPKDTLKDRNYLNATYKPLIEHENILL